MASVNQASLREEFTTLKGQFERLCAAGTVSEDLRALVQALLMLAALLDWLVERDCTASISKGLPSVLLWLWRPALFVFIKPAVFDRFSRAIGEPPLGSGKQLTVEEYFRGCSIMDAVGEEIAALAPRDMIDLQVPTNGQVCPTHRG